MLGSNRPYSPPFSGISLKGEYKTRHHHWWITIIYVSCRYPFRYCVKVNQVKVTSRDKLCLHLSIVIKKCISYAVRNKLDNTMRLHTQDGNKRESVNLLGYEEKINVKISSHHPSRRDYQCCILTSFGWQIRHSWRGSPSTVNWKEIIASKTMQCLH